MNNKQIACIVIGMLIAVQLYTIMMVKGKADVMKQQSADAVAASDSARQQVNISRIQLTSQKTKTEPVRKYLEIWNPYLQQSASEERSQSIVDELIRKGGVQLLTGKYDSVPNQGNAYITNVVRAELLFEDDYHKTLEWLGEIERTLPASRISKCRLSKGTNANDIKMEMTVELPVVADPAAPKA